MHLDIQNLKKKNLLNESNLLDNNIYALKAFNKCWYPNAVEINWMHVMKIVPVKSYRWWDYVWWNTYLDRAKWGTFIASSIIKTIQYDMGMDTSMDMCIYCIPVHY